MQDSEVVDFLSGQNVKAEWNIPEDFGQSNSGGYRGPAPVYILFDSIYPHEESIQLTPDQYSLEVWWNGD